MSETRQWRTSSACYGSLGSGGGGAHDPEMHLCRQHKGASGVCGQSASYLREKRAQLAGRATEDKKKIITENCSRGASESVCQSPQRVTATGLFITNKYVHSLVFYDVLLTVNKSLSRSTTVRRKGHFMPPALPHWRTSPLAAPWIATRRS